MKRQVDDSYSSGLENPFRPLCAVVESDDRYLGVLGRLFDTSYCLTSFMSSNPSKAPIFKRVIGVKCIAQEYAMTYNE